MKRLPPDPLHAIEPTAVWRHFLALAAIPRPSKHEAAAREHVARWAGSRGFATETDAAGNLLIRKPASKGGEALPGYALPGHLDMVCQASEPGFDFLRRGIEPRLTERGDGLWVEAPGTTLGADNGLGVALALAALEDQALVHGPLEVLLTVDEEAGMGGAAGLAPGWLQSRRMLNLDTEAFGEFYVGCAGGCDVEVQREVRREAAPYGLRPFRLRIGGLVGGHSGCDIHRGRGNANRLLVAALAQIAEVRPGAVRLCALEGGTARNAIPRQASADVLIDPTVFDAVEQRLADFAEGMRIELAGIEDGLSIRLEKSPGNALQPNPVTDADRRALLQALAAAPCGVAAMSAAVPGVVETSNNLGVMKLDGRGFSANLMVRSLLDAGTTELADRIEAVFKGAGCTAAQHGRYPGWAPDPASPLLAHAKGVFESTFGHRADTQVIHAGLECGLIADKHPGLDILSFGPTIDGAHAPGERVKVESVAQTWRLLRAILSAPH
jgi:dipeptidase D